MHISPAQLTALRQAAAGGSGCATVELYEVGVSPTQALGTSRAWLGGSKARLAEVQVVLRKQLVAYSLFGLS